MSELPPDYFNAPVSEVDPEIAEVLALELARQQRTLEMIASENFVPASVLETQGSVLTNKYAEGYPGRRYYGGCEYVDMAEQLAIDRAKSLFGAEHANVQPHAGAQANTAIYQALLEPGDRLMGLELSHGGHLTHGMRLNASGRLYEIVTYGVDRESGLIDMDEVARIARERRPKMIIAGWPTRGTSTSHAFARSPMRSVPTCSSTWLTLPGWSRPACTPVRSLTQTWWARRSTRRSVVRGRE
jgi:glycine hydroxymethyltransferase